MASVNSNSTVLQNTIDMLSELNEYELNAVQSVIRVIISKQDDYYKTLSEEDMFSKIDISIAQVEAGLAEDSEVVEDEIMSEFGLWRLIE